MAKLRDADLQREAFQINYSLRSSFFYRRLREQGYFRLLRDVETLCADPRAYSWEDRVTWRITDAAWGVVAGRGMSPLRVFAHPKVLADHPSLVAYYRNVAVIPLKGVNYLAFDVSRYEKPAPPALPYTRAVTLVRVFNAHVSNIVESTQRLEEAEIAGLMFGSAGVSVDGSWRNKIGQEAEIKVRSYLVRHAIERSLVTGLIDASGSPQQFDSSADYIGTISEYSGFKLRNHWSVRFGQEPDVAFINPAGQTVCAIEVKRGSDPAGALERLGAAKKSFEAVRRENPKARTILVASCITEQMRRRAETDPLVSEIANLTQMVWDLGARERFLKSLEPYFRTRD